MLHTINNTNAISQIAQPTIELDSIGALNTIGNWIAGQSDINAITLNSVPEITRIMSRIFDIKYFLFHTFFVKILKNIICYLIISILHFFVIFFSLLFYLIILILYVVTCIIILFINSSGN